MIGEITSSSRVFVGPAFPADHVPTVAELEALTDITHTVKRPPHRVLDLFAGTGVGVACQQLGVEEFGVEIWEPAVKSREANGMSTVYRDVWDAGAPERLGLDFDTLWASPPCQSFSMAGKGAGRKALDDVLEAIENGDWRTIADLKALSARVGDDRTALVLTPLHYIHRYRPAYVVFEQVPPVLPVWEAHRAPLEAMGYSVWVGYLNSEQYGVPQTRKRAYLMARRDGKAVNPPTPTHSRYYSRTPERLDEGVEKWVSMAEALGRFAGRPSPTVTGGGR